MKYLFVCMLVLFLSCNSGRDGDGTSDSLPDPELVNPPQDAIPEDMTIKKDSVVVPDSVALRNASGDSANRAGDTMRH